MYHRSVGSMFRSPEPRGWQVASRESVARASRGDAAHLQRGAPDAIHPREDVLGCGQRPGHEETDRFGWVERLYAPGAAHAPGKPLANVDPGGDFKPVPVLGGRTTSKSGPNPTTKRNWTPPNQNQPGVLLHPGLTSCFQKATYQGLKAIGVLWIAWSIGLDGFPSFRGALCRSFASPSFFFFFCKGRLGPKGHQVTVLIFGLSLFETGRMHKCSTFLQRGTFLQRVVAAEGSLQQPIPNLDVGNSGFSGRRRILLSPLVTRSLTSVS